jgi:hypothetical protein
MMEPNERTQMQIGEVITVVKIAPDGRMTKITGPVTGMAEAYFKPDTIRIMISSVESWLDMDEWVVTNG